MINYLIDAKLSDVKLRFLIIVLRRTDPVGEQRQMHVRNRILVQLSRQLRELLRVEPDAEVRRRVYRAVLTRAVGLALHGVRAARSVWL